MDGGTNAARVFCVGCTLAGGPTTPGLCREASRGLPPAGVTAVTLPLLPSETWRWLLSILIGAVMGLLAFLVDWGIDAMNGFKFSRVTSAVAASGTQGPRLPRQGLEASTLPRRVACRAAFACPAWPPPAGDSLPPLSTACRRLCCALPDPRGHIPDVCAGGGRPGQVGRQRSGRSSGCLARVRAGGRPTAASLPACVPLHASACGRQLPLARVRRVGLRAVPGACAS